VSFSLYFYKKKFIFPKEEKIKENKKEKKKKRKGIQKIINYD